MSKAEISKVFALLELLVVVSIVTALFAILLPALSAARSAAKVVVRGNNLRHMGGLPRQPLVVLLPPISPERSTTRRHIRSRGVARPMPAGSCAAYNYRPYADSRKRLQEMLLADVLAHDFVHWTGNVPHGSAVGPGWNIVFPDGHVRFIQNQEMTAFHASAAPLSDDWTLFAKALNLLLDGQYTP